MRFQDKVCIVTGAGSGIGKAASLQFAREGGKVLLADLSEQHGNEAALEIVRANGHAIFVKCDVGDPDNVKSAVKTAVDNWGKIDVLVNGKLVKTITFTVVHP